MGIEIVFRCLEMAGDFKKFGSIFANSDMYLFLTQNFEYQGFDSNSKSYRNMYLMHLKVFDKD